MKGEKKSSPYRTLVKLSIIFAVAAVVLWVAVEGINFYRANALDQKKAEVEATNKQLDTEYQVAKAEYESLTRTGQSKLWPEAPAEGTCIIDLSAYPLENSVPAEVSRAALFEGGMILVNYWHPLPSDATDANIKSVREWTSSRVPISSNAVRLYQAAAEAIDSMVIDAGLQDLKDYIVQEAYRSNQDQQEKYDGTVASIQKRNPNISGDALVAEAIKTVSMPGTSDFQTGLTALIKLYNKDDAKITNTKFQESEQGKWFTENCWKYGLVFRFPTADFPNTQTEDKTYKTGISTALNAYRYVGVAHSTAMKILNMCLEEYIEYLIATPHIAIFENGKLKYEVYRQPYEGGDATIQVPLAVSGYVASMDNMGGVITAYYYD